jgi:2-polyprenyl-6-methoxyphenol hydroxylase-like FAD-dependent oxidoreductase
MPDVLTGLIDRGAAVTSRAADPWRPGALLCRREVLEVLLWRSALREPGITVITGHVDRVLAEGGRITGAAVSGRTVKAALVIDASGRASRALNDVRAPAHTAPCGAAYVGRQYRLHPNAEPGQMNSPIGLSLSLPGYLAVAFVHDSGTFSVTITHGGDDHRMRELRHPDVFESAVKAIPRLGDWIDPQRSAPITPVLPGGQLFNSYRRQSTDGDHPVAPGLISVGDAVCTTTPLAGRGVTMAFLQARELVHLLDQYGSDVDSATMAFDDWCEQRIRPWFTDHVYCDTERMVRWSGHDVDLDRPLPSDLIVAAADAAPELAPLITPYSVMDEGPESLARAEPHAREIYESGWRPAFADGPTRTELARLRLAPHSHQLRAC